MADVRKRMFLGLLLSTLFWSSGYAAELVDPMKPVQHQAVAKHRPAAEAADRVDTTGWRLSAVLCSGERAVAVINGQPMLVGETLDGYELIAIETDKAELRNGKKKLVLQRAGSGLKKNIR